MGTACRISGSHEFLDCARYIYFFKCNPMHEYFSLLPTIFAYTECACSGPVCGDLPASLACRDGPYRESDSKVLTLMPAPSCLRHDLK